jgi:hypothetical protein
MTTKTIRSRFNHEIGETVEGCTIVAKEIISPPDPVEKRRGIYDYLVEVPPIAARPKSSAKASPGPKRDSFTRSTPEEMGGVIRRLPGR